MFDLHGWLLAARWPKIIYCSMHRPGPSSSRGDEPLGGRDDSIPPSNRMPVDNLSDDRRLTQEILDIAFPMMLTLAADPTAGLVDTAFIGRLGGFMGLIRLHWWSVSIMPFIGRLGGDICIVL